MFYDGKNWYVRWEFGKEIDENGKLSGGIGYYITEEQAKRNPFRAAGYQKVLVSDEDLQSKLDGTVDTGEEHIMCRPATQEELEIGLSNDDRSITGVIRYGR